jgi:cytochrome c biogenesis protein CcmG/thiol:disulfide interchange protein DsbE
MQTAADERTPPGPDSLPPTPGRNLSWVIAPVLIFGAIVALFAFALQTGDPSRLPSALIGKPAPATQFPPLEGLVDDGRPVPGFSSAQLAGGKVSVVNFWASWCIPCAEEQPLLIELQKQTGVALYGVNYKDDAVAARRFLGRYGNPFTAVGTDTVGRSAIEWGVYGMPETYVLNGRGEIVFKHVGPISPESLQARLVPAIAQAQAQAASAAPALKPN